MYFVYQIQNGIEYSCFATLSYFFLFLPLSLFLSMDEMFHVFLKREMKYLDPFLQL